MDFPWDLKTFGLRLRKLRKEREWTQEELASRVGCEPETISRWERGRRPPQKDNLEALALAFYGTTDTTQLTAGLPRAAATPLRGTSVSPLRPIARDALLGQYRDLLKQKRRLLLLGSWRGGARTLARQLVAEPGLWAGSTLLRPPVLPDLDTKGFFGLLTDDHTVTDADRYLSWQRAKIAGRRHLIFLEHDGGDPRHLQALAAALRRLWDEDRERKLAHFLVAGEAQAAALRLLPAEHSLLSGMELKYVPDLSVAEVAEALPAEAGEVAAALHAATGGHVGLLADVVAAGPPWFHNGEWATEFLAESERLWGRLAQRLARDPTGAGRQALRALLEWGMSELGFSWYEGRLDAIETRLFYDGLLRRRGDGDAQGSEPLVPRCAAVVRVMAAMLRGGQP